MIVKRKYIWWLIAVFFTLQLRSIFAFDPDYWSQESHGKTINYSREIRDYRMFGLHFGLGKTIGNLVLQGQTADALVRSWHHYDLDKIKKNGAFAHITKIVSGKDAILDGIELFPPQFSTIPIKDKKYILYSNGNAAFFEDSVYDLAENALVFNAATVSYNPRGVGQSSSYTKSYRQLVMDLIVQIQRVLDLGIQPYNLTVHGHSLGGATAAFAVSYFHKKGIKIKLFADRTFADLRKLSEYMIPKFSNIKTGTASVLTKVGLNLVTAWRMIPYKAYKRIDPAYRTYLNYAGDDIIPTNYSLHHRVQNCDGAGFMADSTSDLVNDGHNSTIGSLKISSLDMDGEKIFKAFFYATATDWLTCSTVTNPEYQKECLLSFIPKKNKHIAKNS